MKQGELLIRERPLFLVPRQSTRAIFSVYALLYK